MWSLLIFIPIIALTVIVSRKNMCNRGNELTENANSFAQEIIKIYSSIDNESQKSFFNNLTEKETEYFKILLNSPKFNYGKNVWQIQQSLIRQQEIMYKLKKFI